MDKVIETIRELFKKQNRLYLLIVLGFIVILMAIIVQLIPTKKNSEPDTIDQPFDFDSQVRVIIDDVKMESNSNLTKVYVYDIKQSDHSDIAQGFLNKVGKGFWRRTNYDDIYYVWSNDATPNYYLADYDNIKDTLFFRFEDAVQLEELNGVTDLLGDDPTSLMEEIFYQYLDMKVNFHEPVITTNKNEIRLEARRDINGIPLEVRGNEGYSDYLVFDIAGRLKEGSLLLVEYSEPEKVKLFAVGYLGSAINQKAYPKDVISGFPAGLDLEDLGYEPYEYSEDFLGDPPPYDFDEDEMIPNKCEVTSIELVYYFVRTNTSKLAPVYKLGCRGEVEIDKNIYQVPVMIYANALDPEVVYVPGTLVQE